MATLTTVLIHRRNHLPRSRIEERKRVTQNQCFDELIAAILPTSPLITIRGSIAAQ